MSQEADWLQWHEDRWNLPPSQGGRQEYAPNGPPRGIVPFPLTDAEFDLLLKRFFLADDMLTDAQANGHEILDTEVAQTLRGKLMEWVEAFGQFPVIADTNAHSNNYDALLQPEEYFKWYTVADAKAHMLADIPGPELKDSSGNDLPDDFPVLVLAPRKYGGFGGVVFYHDDWPDSNNWALYVTKAKDFIADNPVYHDWLIENGGYVSDTDLVYQLHLSRTHFMNSTYITNLIISIIQQNIGTLNLNYTSIFVKYPTTAPGGTWPPGTGPIPDSGATPSTLDPNNVITFDCVNTPVTTHTGADSTDFAANLGFAALAAVPVPVYHPTAVDIRPAIITALQNSGQISDINAVDLVEVCLEFAYLDRIDIQAFGVTQSVIKSKPITLTTVTLAQGGNPSVSYPFTVPASEGWETPEFNFRLPAIGNVKAKARVAISNDDKNTVIFDHFQDIAQILLDCELLPAIFGNFNNPFDNIVNSPYLFIGLKTAIVRSPTWRGVGVPLDVDQPCAVGNIQPGFFQDSYGFDWKNATGDTQNLFSGVNWGDVDNILLEVYIPAAGGGLWMPPSGSNNQAIMDAWRAANPEVYRDAGGNMILYGESLATNQICYTWLRVPAGQTNFAVDMAQIPTSCWMRIVAYRVAHDGSFVVQDDAHRCTSIVYPPYPNDPL